MRYYECPFHLNHHNDLFFHSHAHLGYEIILVIDGCLNVSVNNDEIPLCKGQALFIPPYYVHSFKTPLHSECYILEFSSVLIADELPKDSIIFMAPENMTDFFTQIKSIDNVYMKKSAIYYILSTMNYSPLKKIPTSANSLYPSAIKFIAENFHEPITLRDVANKLCVNYSYLSRTFCEHLGMSFTDCLNGTRINHSITLLKETNMSITEIAYSCGFGSARNFNRVFASKMNCSPYEFRKN